MKVIFFLPQGTIEWIVPEDLREGFNFNAFATNVRSTGFFMAPNIYIRHDAMLGMVFSVEGQSSPLVQGMTKQ